MPETSIEAMWPRALVAIGGIADKNEPVALANLVEVDPERTIRPVGQYLASILVAEFQGNDHEN